jgi:peptide/nickel transport system substrate-binding protein
VKKLADRRSCISRRTLIKGATSLAVSGVAGRAAAQTKLSTLRFVHANLSSVDPVATGGYPVRNFAYMVFDTLYAMDTSLRVHPQMAAGHEISSDGKVWTITLREGLKFHDGEPVRGVDCVASIKRWAARDVFGQTLLATTDELSAVDDRRFRFHLKEPFPKLDQALGKQSLNVLFIMPERIAKTEPTVQIREAIGSGPYRFLADEWVPGSRVAYSKFDGYLPRQELPSASSGGKVVNFDKVEWQVIPDSAAAIAALRAGEVDWIDRPDINLISLLESDTNVVVKPYDPLGQYAYMRFNQLQPPFDNIKIRQAVLAAVDQTVYMMAMIGDPNRIQTCKDFFFCGTPLATGAGSNAMASSLQQGKALLSGSGYKGEKVVILTPSDLPWLHPAALVTEDLLKKLGMTVEIQAMDLGTFFTRRASMEPVEKGGWSIFHTAASSVEFIDPASHTNIRGNGKGALPGWPTEPTLERLRLEWLRSDDPDEQKKIAIEIDRQAFLAVPYVPLGVFQQPSAYRKEIKGMLQGPAPFMWNVRRN